MGSGFDSFMLRADKIQTTKSNPVLSVQIEESRSIRSILRSLVPTEDLVGIISIPLKLPSLNKGKGSC